MDRMDKNARARAELMFKVKQAQAKDAPKAASDYRAEADKKLKNMQRLRQLRLAQQD